MENLNMKDNSNQIATFFIGKELFGIDIQNIKEVVRYPQITEVPMTPPYFKGLTNLRGNVMPVIDGRIKLSIDNTTITDNTRVIVLDTGKTPTGIIVDKIQGVKNIEGAKIEDTPSVISNGLDKKYISKVIRLNENIIMELDISAICEIDIETLKKESFSSSSTDFEQKESIDSDIQLVSFFLGEEEYAFNIDCVREILRFTRVTEVPDSPDYMLGMISVRETLLPVIDLRLLFGLPPYKDTILEDVKIIKDEAYNFKKSILQKNDISKKSFDLTYCYNWIRKFSTSSELVNGNIENLKKYYQLFFEKLDKMSDSDKQDSFLISSIEEVLNSITSLEDSISKDIKEDQRILVVDISGLSVGLVVDKMRQVVRVSKSYIEDPPKIFGKKRGKNLTGIAKLDQGKRIIMLLDGKDIIDLENIQNLLEQKKDACMDEIKTSKDEDVQFVTFRLGDVYFGIDINSVQEINRLLSITHVPRMPDFMEGVMNLRGNVIPVLDLRKRFSMDKKEYDDSTRVIIVNISKNLTGLIVDSVSEVLRTTKSSIVSPPSVMKNQSNIEFISGVCKQKDKMILILEVELLLSSDEKIQMGVLTEKTDDNLLNTDNLSEEKNILSVNESKEKNNGLKKKGLKKIREI